MLLEPEMIPKVAEGLLPGNSKTTLDCASSLVQSERDLSFLSLESNQCNIFYQRYSRGQDPEWDKVYQGEM